MPLDGHVGRAGARAERDMQQLNGQAGGSQSPQQLFESARRAVQDGQLAMAEQILRHLIAIAPNSTEGLAAQSELGRLVRHRAQVESMTQAAGQASYVNGHAAQPAHAPHHGQHLAQPPGYVDPGWSAQRTEPSFGAPQGGQTPQMVHVATAQPAQGHYQHGAALQPSPGPLSVGDGGLPTVVSQGRKGRTRAEPRPDPAELGGEADDHMPQPTSRRGRSIPKMSPEVAVEAMPRFRFAKVLAALTSLIGWLGLMGAVAVGAGSAAGAMKSNVAVLKHLALGFPVAGQLLVGGLALIVLAQMAKASFMAAQHAYVTAAVSQALYQSQGHDG